MVTWGINPGQSVGVGERIPNPATAPEPERPTYREALAYMGFEAGQPIAGTKIDVAFIGSCTNGAALRSREAAAAVAKGQPGGHARAGARRAGLAAGGQGRGGAKGLHEVFREAGFEWRDAGCSMCLGMNPDKLEGREICASSSATATSTAGRAAPPAARC